MCGAAVLVAMGSRVVGPDVGVPHSPEAPQDSGTPRSVLRFEGVLTGATLFLDGQPIGEHVGGYVPFEFELTGLLQPGGSVLAVVDCRWGLDVPPCDPGRLVRSPSTFTSLVALTVR